MNSEHEGKLNLRKLTCYPSAEDFKKLARIKKLCVPDFASDTPVPDTLAPGIPASDFDSDNTSSHEQVVSVKGLMIPSSKPSNKREASNARLKKRKPKWNVIPVWHKVSSDFATPVVAYARIARDKNGFLLESVAQSDKWSRWSFIGSNPLAVLVARGKKVQVTSNINFDDFNDYTSNFGIITKSGSNSKLGSGYNPVSDTTLGSNTTLGSDTEPSDAKSRDGSESVCGYGDGFDVNCDSGILEALDDVLNRYHAPSLDMLLSAGSGLSVSADADGEADTDGEGLSHLEIPPLHGGLVGYLGYDVVREIENLPNMPEDDLGNPDAVVSMIGDLVVYDHWRQQVFLIANTVVPHMDGHEVEDIFLDYLYDKALKRLDCIVADVLGQGQSGYGQPGQTFGYGQSGDVDIFGRGQRYVQHGQCQPEKGKSSACQPRQRSYEPSLLEIADVSSEEIECLKVQSTMGAEAYAAAVETAKEHILAGDIFQVALSQRFSLELDGVKAFDVYRALRYLNPSQYMYYLRHDDLEIVGGSPETMVACRDGRVSSRPIAGTRPRGATAEDDRRLALELIGHPKERAEHVMLVDLARNDVGRVIEYGSLKCDKLMDVERYSHVMHLTSEVSGRLSDGKTPVDVLRATLPAGTLSGAPKVRAMEIIDDLEPVKRGLYAGVVGYIDFSGNIDTAITIRTMIVKDQKAYVQAGAGIVADSVGSEEHVECLNKAKALLSAVLMTKRVSAVTD